MDSKRRQPRKQKKSRSGLRKTQRGGGPLDKLRDNLQAQQELPSRVDGLQAKVYELQAKFDELQQQVNYLKENTTTKTEQQNIFNGIIEVLENLKTVTLNPGQYNSNSPLINGLHTKLFNLKESLKF